MPTSVEVVVKQDNQRLFRLTVPVDDSYRAAMAMGLPSRPTRTEVVKDDYRFVARFRPPSLRSNIAELEMDLYVVRGIDLGFETSFPFDVGSYRVSEYESPQGKIVVDVIVAAN